LPYDVPASWLLHAHGVAVLYIFAVVQLSCQQALLTAMQSTVTGTLRHIVVTKGGVSAEMSWS